MKKSIPFLALLVFFIFACNKGTEPQATVDQSSIGLSNDAQTTASDRANCCCRLVVSSTYFNGLTICGVTGGVTACSITTNCGKTCGQELVLPAGNKNANFCFETDCPICFTNNGILPIQIYLICAGGTTVPIPIPAGGTVCCQIDCNGNLVFC